MRVKRAFCGVLLGVVIARSSATHAQQQTPPDRPFPFMAEMEQPYRELRSQIKDPAQNESSLAIVRLLQRNSLAAKEAIPPLISKLPAGQQTLLLTAYKQMMLKAIHLELELEERLLAGQNAKAAATLDALNKIRAEGHDQFRGLYDPATRQRRLPARK